MGFGFLWPCNSRMLRRGPEFGLGALGIDLNINSCFHVTVPDDIQEIRKCKGNASALFSVQYSGIHADKRTPHLLVQCHQWMGTLGSQERPKVVCACLLLLVTWVLLICCLAVLVSLTE